MPFKKIFRSVTKIFKPIIKIVSKALYLGLFLNHQNYQILELMILTILKKGILVNKQSNDASIPVIYGQRLVGGTRIFFKLVAQIIIFYI